jgi:hypothetical protein
LKGKQSVRTYDEDEAKALFQIAHDVAIKRANGICELCHDAPAVKVRRLKDPVWSAFDTPSNLLVVCEA